MKLPNGTRLQGGKYRIERDLGQGGFGITYLARETSSQRQVAIKEFFFKQYCGRNETTSQVYVPLTENTNIVSKFKVKFKKEASMIMGLNNPGIVKVYDTFEENGTSYYVMEYIEGASLKGLLEERGYIPENEAIGYIRKVGEVLNYIHSKNMMHLDIKPDNIMLGKNGKVTVIDFGVSKLYDADTGDSLTATTPVGMSKGYSPFEQTYTGGVKSFSPQSDVYALAATLYKLLTGVTPPSSPEVKDYGLPLGPLREKNISINVANTIVNAMKLQNVRTQSVKEFLRQLDDESTIVYDEDTIVSGENEKTSSGNFSYPLTIPINKKVYTDCQLWRVKSLKLMKTKTVLTMSVQSYDQPTTAWSGTGKIRTDEGDVFLLKNSTLPRKMDESFVIYEWQELNVEETYPPIPTNVTGLNILNDNVIVKGIEIVNGTAVVPDANKEEYVDITRAEYLAKKNGESKASGVSMSSSSKDSEVSITGLIYLVVIIGIILFVFISLIS